MKSKAAKLVATLLAVFALSTSSITPATAEDLVKTTSFTGFAFEKPYLTSAMKAKIRRWVLANATSGFTLVSCTGYTGYNVNKREQAFLQTLAERRSQNICNYIHSIKNVIAVNTTQGIPGDGKTASARKVTVRLISPDTGGGTGGGTGTVVIGVCDNSLNVAMRSRIANGEFYFASITIKDIATACRTKVLDIYLLDASGNQLAVASANAITATSQTFAYTLFSPNQVVSNQIKQVAFEFRAP
jgi:hypothetical protein